MNTNHEAAAMTFKTRREASQNLRGSGWELAFYVAPSGDFRGEVPVYKKDGKHMQLVRQGSKWTAKEYQA